jgi:hypothetical protein
MHTNRCFSRPSWITVAGTLLLGCATATAEPPQEIEGLKQTLERTGVFFRADAPYVLRDATDPFLPICVEIINGVEKTGRSAISKIAPYITREPLKLEGINVFAKPPGARRQFASQPLLLAGGGELTFDARAEGQPLSLAIRWRKTLEIPRAQLADYLRQHYLGGPFDVVDLMVSIRVVGWPAQNTFLRARDNAPPLPELPGWYRGDMHYHSAYTDNPAERGHPLSVTKQAAVETGLRWVVLADHSTELNPASYAQALKEIRQLNDGGLVFIRGEEITAVSAKEGMLTTVHLVALPCPDDPERGFPPAAGSAETVIMGGDGSVGNPAVPLQAALSRIAAAGGFAYAAHPFDPISPILRGGTWDLASDFLAPDGMGLQPGLVGLEPWNRATTVTADNARDPYCIQRDSDPAACFQPDKDANHYTRLERGIELGWRPLLEKGLAENAPSPPFKVLLAVGSDAHGDFNYEATMDAVDFLSKPSRGLSGYAEDNAFGKLATVVYCPSGMGARGENILRALQNGQSVLSNGPLLVAGFDLDKDGNLGSEGDIMPGGRAAWDAGAIPPLQLQWASSKEFGPLASIRLIVGTRRGEAGAQEIPVPAGKEIESQGLVPIDLHSYMEALTAGWGYIRLEARTRNAAGEEFRCYTNPVWVRVTVP